MFDTYLWFVYPCNYDFKKNEAFFKSSYLALVTSLSEKSTTDFTNEEK